MNCGARGRYAGHQLECTRERGHLGDHLDLGKQVQWLRDSTTSVYAAMLQAVKIDRLSETGPENEGIENRFHRAGADRISFDEKGNFVGCES